MSTDSKNTAPEVRYGGYLSAVEKNTDGVAYSYNWKSVTHKADLDKRSKEVKKAEAAADKEKAETT